MADGPKNSQEEFTSDYGLIEVSLEDGRQKRRSNVDRLVPGAALLAALLVGKVPEAGAAGVDLCRNFDRVAQACELVGIIEDYRNILAEAEKKWNDACDVTDSDLSAARTASIPGKINRFDRFGEELRQILVELDSIGRSHPNSDIGAIQTYSGLKNIGTQLEDLRSRLQEGGLINSDGTPTPFADITRGAVLLTDVNRTLRSIGCSPSVEVEISGSGEVDLRTNRRRGFVSVEAPYQPLNPTNIDAPVPTTTEIAKIYAELVESAKDLEVKLGDLRRLIRM